MQHAARRGARRFEDRERLLERRALMDDDRQAELVG